MLDPTSSAQPYQHSWRNYNSWSRVHLRSPGAGYDPTEVVPAKKDHVLPVAPRVALHPEGASQEGPEHRCLKWAQT